MKKILLSLPLLVLTACSPVDRSDEQPLAPTVQTGTPTVEGPRALLTGDVLASPNSDVLRRGFGYGNDTLRAEVESTDSTSHFVATTDSLGPGHYFVVAFAENGVGTSYGDTLYFQIGS